jgi:hypothetical protein
MEREKRIGRDVAGKLMEFEMGEMDSTEEVLALFQDLVDSGLAWKLQGRYGRTAAALLQAGLIKQDASLESYLGSEKTGGDPDLRK